MKSETLQILIKSGFGYEAIINVNYNGMKGNKYPVYEIIGTRVTIKLNNREIDFNINEVELSPISYNNPNLNMIRTIKRSKL
jgi:hypothetical protein